MKLTTTTAMIITAYTTQKYMYMYMSAFDSAIHSRHNKCPYNPCVYVYIHTYMHTYMYTYMAKHINVEYANYTNND